MQSKILAYTLNGQNSVPIMLAPLYVLPNYELFSIKLHVVYTFKDDSY